MKLIKNNPVHCFLCKHNIDSNLCSAFKTGKPIQIISGEIQHIKPLLNQGNNTIFEPINGR